MILGVGFHLRYAEVAQKKQSNPFINIRAPEPTRNSIGTLQCLELWEESKIDATIANWCARKTHNGLVFKLMSTAVAK